MLLGLDLLPLLLLDEDSLLMMVLLKLCIVLLQAMLACKPCAWLPLAHGCGVNSCHCCHLRMLSISLFLHVCSVMSIRACLRNL